MTNLLTVSEVSKRYGGLLALDSVSFQASPGEIIGLIGPNGSGKTTLFSVLVGLKRRTNGSIQLVGEEISHRKPHEIAKRGMTKTFQNAALFPDMTVLENVLTGALLHHRLPEAKEAAHSALKRVGMIAAANRSASDLTFPQRAMTEMARALCTQPKVLLLDEVMAALTPVEMDEILFIIRSLRDNGLTIIVVEHHMRAIMSLCDRILVLNFGRLIASGSPKQVSRDPEVIRAYLGHQDPREPRSK
jgi:branched-chain amino acid transport system ATP-binding protein